MVAPHSQSLLEANCRLLSYQQPVLAKAIESFNPNFQCRSGEVFEIKMSATGKPVLLLNGNPFHSLQDPLGEAEQAIRQAGILERQSRYVFLGFGFGYHLLPLIKNGFSPIVYEPSLAVLYYAFSTVDLSSLIPFVTIHTGPRTPDLPRNSHLFSLPASQELFPVEAQVLSRKLMNDNNQGGNMEAGIYCGAYRNVTCLKNPCDLFAYQMVLSLVRPTLIIEIGTCRGGSALWFADQLRILGGPRRIHTYDVVDEVPAEVLEDPMITFHKNGWQEFHPSLVLPSDRVLLIEDSSHTYENTAAVLEAFCKFVTPNSYFIVEDGSSGYTRPAFNGGPIRAIEEFLPRHPEFEVDSRWEDMFGASNSNCLKGFLRRKP